MQIKDSVALVTGANRGIGARLVAQLLDGGARKVYAAARRPELITVTDVRVVPLRLDVTDAAAITTAAGQATDVTLLINNAGTLAFGGPLDGDLEEFERDLATNYVGLLRMSRAFVPALEPGSAIVNILTIVGLAAMPGMTGYCASKAAAHLLTQALRSELTQRGVAVHGAYPGGVDTDMLAGVDVPKANPADVARAVLAGVEAGEEEIFPDSFSAAAYQTWTSDPRSLAHQFAT